MANDSDFFDAGNRRRTPTTRACRQLLNVCATFTNTPTPILTHAHVRTYVFTCKLAFLLLPQFSTISPIFILFQLNFIAFFVWALLISFTLLIFHLSPAVVELTAIEYVRMHKVF